MIRDARAVSASAMGIAEIGRTAADRGLTILRRAVSFLYTFMYKSGVTDVYAQMKSER